jgi:hypothetical protein
MEAVLAEAETEVRHPLVAVPPLVVNEPAAESLPAAASATAEPEETEPDEEPSPPTPTPSVASIIDELPTLDLTDEGPARVSSRPWERG